MPIHNIEEVFARIACDGDDRRAPDARRRGQFRAGWEDVAERGELYAETTLKRLTWHNLGYRFGQHCGSVTPEDVDATYDVLAATWEQVWGAESGQAGSAAPSAEHYLAAFVGKPPQHDTAANTTLFF